VVEALIEMAEMRIITPEEEEEVSVVMIDKMHQMMMTEEMAQTEDSFRISISH
jgi:hypothetical protein